MRLHSIIWITLLLLGGLFGCYQTLPDRQTVSAASEVSSLQTNSQTFKPPSTYNEAPNLAAQVVAGQLPPVEERLPQNPVIIQPVERVGVYGGVWRMGLLEAGSRDGLRRTLGYENLVRWNPAWTQVIPNVAHRVEANDQATDYTFYLRAGLRWSNGTPFTAADILFWYEAVYANEALTPRPPRFLPDEDNRLVVEKLDDTTVVFRFTRPHGLFLQLLASPDGFEPTGYPRHYLAQFHPDYNPNVETLVKEAGLESWVELFEQKAAWQNAALPTLHAWVLSKDYSDTTTQLSAERNAYYWKIDPAGNQLPYIDRIVYRVGDIDDIKAWILAGEIDMQDYGIMGAPEYRAEYEARAQQGDYHFFSKISSTSNVWAIALNLTHPDPIKREIFQNKNFRIGLSHAINRPRLIAEALGGVGEPYQVAPRPESRFYNERLARQYTAYDPALANDYLDKAGYAARDAAGFRLGPDGRRISFGVEVFEERAESRLLIMELIRQDWQAVGIEVKVQRLDDLKLLREHIAANQYEAVAYPTGVSPDVILRPYDYMPIPNDSRATVAWAYWYGDPQHPLAEEPPPGPKRQMALYDQLRATADPEEQIALMQRILEIAADEFYLIGVALRAEEGYGIVKNNFHNVPKAIHNAWIYHNPAPTNPSQYFIEK